MMRQAWTRRRFFTTASAAAVTSLGLSGCDEADQHASESFRAEQVSFEDLDGRTITLPHPAERIVALAPPYAAMALAVHGSPERLAGIHPRARDMFAKSFVSEIFPEVLEIPTNIVVGGDFTPNVEGVARLAPDVVVQWGELGEALTAPLENAGLTVARYRTLPDGPEATLSAMLTMLGKMTGDGRRALRLNTVIGDTSRRLKEAVSALPQGDRQRVLLVTRVGGALHASGGGGEGLYSYYIYRAGGINVAEALPDYSAIGLEQIAVWDPDVILLFGIQGESPEAIFNDPLLRSSKAAISRRVYVLPTGSHYWGALGPEDALTHMWMAELFYPDRMTSMLRDEMRQTYLAMFDKPLSEQQLSKVLASDINGASAHYERFVS